MDPPIFLICLHAMSSNILLHEGVLVLHAGVQAPAAVATGVASVRFQPAPTEPPPQGTAEPSSQDGGVS